MTLEGKSVLVTGGTGFLGSRLVEKLVLEHAARVRVLVRNFRRVSRIACMPVEMVPGDVADKASLQKAARGCEILFHCAYDFSGSGEHQAIVGMTGTRNASEAALNEHVSRMIHVSTLSVYGPTTDGDLTESSPWQPSENTYTRVKRDAERLVLNLYRREGLPVVVVQPTLVYGPFSSHWTIDPAIKLQTGLVPLVDRGQGYCNAVYIDDVIDAMILAALQPGVLGETFLISGKEPVTWRTFYDTFQDRLGVHATVEVSAQELETLLEKQAARRPRTIPLLKSLLREPFVSSQLARLPITKSSVKIFRKYLSNKQWNSLKTCLLGTHRANGKQNGQLQQHIHTPHDYLFALYRSKTRVCIDKAETYLGYRPRFGFQQGMDLASNFLFWANLAPSHEPATKHHSTPAKP